MVRRLVLLVMLPALAACASAADSSTDPIEPEGAVVDARLGQTFRLRAGTTARLPDGVLVFFRGATNDSRCPRAATCVWSGDATLHLQATAGRREWTALLLHTDILPQAGDFYGRMLTVIGLSPDPVAGRKIPTGDYVAVLRVD